MSNPKNNEKSPNASYEVGHGKPPKEHQFKPGQCPNPRGRGAKKVSTKGPVGPSRFEQELLEFAQSCVGQIDGEDVSAFNSILRAMRSKVMDRPELGKIILQEIISASKAEAALKQELLDTALAFKDEWGPKFAIARRAGRPEPNVVPHPDDVIISPTGEVSVVGPLTEDQARKLAELIEVRDDLFAAVRFVLKDWCGSEVELKRIWKKARRQFYRISPQIPKRLKEPFPRFER